MNLIPRDHWFDIEPIFSNLFTAKNKDNDDTFFSPRVDITEKAQHYEIVADLPGVKKDDVNMQLQDGLLSIEAKINEESKSENDKVIRKERKTGYFSRSFNVGKGITPDDIEANFSDGVLKVHFRKSAEFTDEKRQIPIN